MCSESQTLSTIDSRDAYQSQSEWSLSERWGAGKENTQDLNFNYLRRNEHVNSFSLNSKKKGRRVDDDDDGGEHPIKLSFKIYYFRCLVWPAAFDARVVYFCVIK